MPFARLRRRLDWAIRSVAKPITPAATGAAFGAGAGLGSAVLVDLWCPVSYVPHLLLGHVLPIAILAAAGALIGWRVLAIRRRGSDPVRPAPPSA